MIEFQFPTGQYIEELQLTTCTVYKRPSTARAAKPIAPSHGGKRPPAEACVTVAEPATGHPSLSKITRGPEEQAFEFFARLQSAWEDAVEERSTSWSGGDMRKHFCSHVGQ